MSGRVPEETVLIPAVRQRWRSVSFFHWSFDPAVVARLLPERLEPDLFEGRAWVGITPFHVAGYRLLGIPGFPGGSAFEETNVRTYVRGPDGRDGIWFLSLDASSAVTAFGGRLGYGVAYFLSDMTVDHTDGVVAYRGARLPPAPAASHRVVVRPGAPIPMEERSELDDWLTGRWRAYGVRRHSLVRGNVAHESWPLQRASVVKLEEDLLAAAGLPVPEADPLVHFSPGVDARLSRPRRVG